MRDTKENRMEIINGSISSEIKALIINGWKNRWTVLQWDLNSRQIIKEKGIQRKVVAKTLLEYACTGSLPNQLILSYLKHDVASKLLTPCQAIENIVEFESFHKTHCILGLLEIVSSVKVGSSRSDVTSEDPLSIACSFARLLLWYLGILSESCAKLADLKYSPVHAELLDEVLQIAHNLVRSDFERSMIILALLSNMNLYSVVSRKIRDLETLFRHFTNAGLPSVTPAIGEEFKIFLNDLNSCACRLELPSPKSVEWSHSKYQTYGSIYGAITVEALLRPASDGKKIVKQLVFLRKWKGLTMSELYCEVLRGAYLGLSSSSQENTKWDAFFFVRLPVLIGILQQICSSEVQDFSSTSNDLIEAIEHLLHQAIQLINVCDSRWHCSTLEVLMSEIRKQTGLLSEEVIQLLSNKKHGLSAGVVKPSSRDSQGTTPVLVSMSLADSLLRTLDDESKKQEVTLDVLTKILSSCNTLEIVCTAVAAGGRLPQFTARFVRLNEMACLPSPEGSRPGFTRANLFDISFLMLCYICQNYGMHLVQQGDNASRTFFCDWAQDHLNGASSGEDDVVGGYMDQLLAQFLGSEMDPRTPQTRWPDQCTQATFVIKEILVAWSMDLISEADAMAYTRTLRKYMTSLAVCAAVYLANRYQTWPEPQKSRAFALMECLASPPMPEELTTADKKERLALMSMVISKLITEVKPKDAKQLATTITSSLGTTKSLDELFVSCWTQAVTAGYVDHSSIATFDALLATAGPCWFVSEILKACLSESHCLDNQRALEVAFSAVSLSAVACCIALAGTVIPELLESKAEVWDVMEQLAGPTGEHAVHLIISLLALGLDLESEADDPVRDSRGKRALAADVSEFPRRKAMADGFSRPGGQVEFSVRSAIHHMFESMQKLIETKKILPRSLIVGKLLNMLVTSGMNSFVELVPYSLVDAVNRKLPDVIPASNLVRLYQCHTPDGREGAIKALCLQKSALHSQITL